LIEVTLDSWKVNDSETESVILPWKFKISKIGLYQNCLGEISPRDGAVGYQYYSTVVCIISHYM
jgi:hypothetical protein